MPDNLTDPANPAAPTGAVRWILRAEGLAVLTVCAAVYAGTGFGWARFALLFLAPDISMLFYLAGPRRGAVAYNSVHSYVGPVVLGLAGLLAQGTTATALALIWAAHIGFDRLLGYGLKYPSAFGHTHLGVIGGMAARRTGSDL
jgi:hypothetical protein